VLITNSDYVIAKPRLEFEEGRRYYLPHPMEDELLETYRKKHGKPLSEDGNVRFFSPARQDWQANDPSLSKGNDRVVQAVANLKKEGIENIRVTFVDWGRDADATRELISKLDVEEQFRWTRPLAKGDLWKAYLASHAVIDQFFLDAFGGVTYEALALGRRVITRDDGKANVQFFEGNPPPLLSAASVREITARMREVANDPADSKAVGLASREWITEMHSAHRIADIIGQVFDHVAEIGSPKIIEAQSDRAAAIASLPEPSSAVVTPDPMVDESMAADAAGRDRADITSSGVSAAVKSKAPARRKTTRKTATTKKSAAKTESSSQKTAVAKPAAKPTTKAKATQKTTTKTAGTKKPMTKKTPAKSSVARDKTAAKPGFTKPITAAKAKKPITKSAVVSKAKTTPAKPAKPKAQAAKSPQKKPTAKPTAKVASEKAKPRAVPSKTAPNKKPAAKKSTAKPAAKKATASRPDQKAGLVPVSQALAGGAKPKATTKTSPAKKPVAKKPVTKKVVKPTKKASGE